MSIDRSEVARALAKAIAYKQVGNDALANEFGVAVRGITAYLQRANITLRTESEAKLVTPRTQHKIEMICDNCHNPFLEYPKRRPKKLKFCGRQCGFDYQAKKVEPHDLDREFATHHMLNGTVVYDAPKKEMRNV